MNVYIYERRDNYNIITITPYRGYNPEVSYKSSNMMPGFDWGCYPLSRIYSVGLNLTF